MWTVAKADVGAWVSVSAEGVGVVEGKWIAVGRSLQEAERLHIVAVLEKTNWIIGGSNGAAEILKINPSTLRSRMKKLGIERSKPNPTSSTSKARTQEAIA